MQMFWDILGQILLTLWAHKLRSFLTMFGIAWGVGSLLLLVGVGEGFRSGNKKGFDELGQDVMFIFPGRAPAVRGSQQSGHWYPITYKDYLDIRKSPHVRAASPALQRDDIRSVSDYSNGNGSVFGVEPQFRGIRYLPIQQGRWLNVMDETERRNVVVIGKEIVRTLFPGRPALGNTLLLNGIPFEVVGTLDNIGRGDNVSQNSRIYIPFSVMKTFFPRNWGGVTDPLSFINYQPRVRAEHLIAQQEVRNIIARNHGFDPTDLDSFEEWDSIRSAEMVARIFDAMDMFLGFVGVVTLALGGIGVINIMMISVTERTREIGLRKALGATNRSIMFQFFTEGALLTFTSGGIGVAAAAAITASLSGVKFEAGFDPPRIVFSSAVLAVCTLAIAGIAAGLYPARRAAKLAPIEALRQE
jgi:putative ABC transport system permease protein